MLKRLALISLLPLYSLSAQVTLSGSVSDKAGVLPYASIRIQEQNLQTSSDLKGKFVFEKLDTGRITLNVYLIGYERQVVEIDLQPGSNQADILLVPSSFSLKELVVTGNRELSRRTENAVLVHVLNGKMLELTQSNNLSEGLCYQPGLRMETDCQTCGFSQLRMNGLPGSYSQVLINSRPVFPSLLSMYGLEQFPASITDRVEIVKGGGSVLFGSSAIAGTVNIITKTPDKNDYSANVSTALIGGSASDHNASVNVSRVNEKKSAGITFMLNGRMRDDFDANKDGFSELPRLKSGSIGFSSFLKPGKKSEFELQFFNINEERQGGSNNHGRPDLAQQSEYRLHHVFAADAAYKYTISGNTNLRVYSAAQTIWRSHYTGIDQVNGWGLSRVSSAQSGIQLNKTLTGFPLGKNTFVAGAEHQIDDTFDEIRAYDYRIDQIVTLTGFFVQSDWELHPKIRLSAGHRINLSNRLNKAVHTPRASLMWNPLDALQLRASWSKGFKAPQAFETDMHIAFAGGGVSVIEIDPQLRAEFSDGITLSASYTLQNERRLFSLSVDYFQTRLQNNFILEEIGFDAAGNQRLYRTNGTGALYEGLTFEIRAALNDFLMLQSAFTLQKAQLNSPVFWSAELPGESRQLRTPFDYGYLSLSAFNKSRLQPSVNLVYTGSMLVPHFAGAPGIANDRLIISEQFFDLGLRLNYRSGIQFGEMFLEFQCGVHNVLNAYQHDFDIGKNRDSNYVYGPGRPRTIFVGIKI